MNQINCTIRELLDKHSIQSAPVDIFQVVQDEGLRLLIDDIEYDHSGFLLVEGGKATVVINRRHHPNRQRFTAAHELGHYFLHACEDDHIFVDKAYHRSPLSSTGIYQQEIEANRFAAALLMPEEFIIEHTDGIDLTDLDIYRLADEFGVSEQAMTLRLANLQLIDVS